LKKLTALSLCSVAIAAAGVTPFPEPVGPVYPPDKRNDSAELARVKKLAAKRLRLLSRRERQLSVANTNLHRRWNPTVDYALRLASAVYGVSYWQLWRVSRCESTHDPFAVNGKYRGLFQEGPMFESSAFGHWGFSVWDPVANALTAARVVSHEGWGQWQCRP
jgi:hypothetical protein